MNDSDQLDFWRILEPIWNDAVLFDPCPDVYLRRFDQLTEPQKVLFPTVLLVGDIKNGGFHQCFWNTTGLYAPEAVIGFRVLDLGTTASVVQAAIDIFGTPFPRERERRIEFLDSFTGDEPEDWNPFFVLDDQFFDSLVPERGSSSGDDRFDVAINKYSRQF